MGGSGGDERTPNGHFVVDGHPGWGGIRLRQLDRSNFALESTITYLVETGLDCDAETFEVLRTVGPVDRYFPFMLQDLGVRWAKRWLIWAAVAFRSRWEAHGWKRWTLIAWAAMALAGSVVLVGALIDGNGVLAAAALVAPLLASPLWGRQAGAGLIAAYFGFFAGDDRAGTESFLGSGD